jgi:hypothetical protein
MAEPEYIGAFLDRPSLPPVPPHQTVENCDDGSLDEWRQYLDFSSCTETPATEPTDHGSGTSGHQ